MPNEKGTVAINKGIPEGTNITIVGDFFMAEAILAETGKGYQQTIFTRHAPTVQNQMMLFDLELNEILKKQGIKPIDSKQVALNEIRAILNTLNSNPRY